MEIEKFPLKCCPLCGCEAEFMFDEDSKLPYTYIECTDCGLKSPIFQADVDTCAMQEAAEFWNHRFYESEDNNDV